MTGGGHILLVEGGIVTPPLDRPTRNLLAITAVSGLLLAFIAAVLGSAVLASVSAVASATAATIAIGVSRRARPVAEQPQAPAVTAQPAPPMGTPPPVIPGEPEEHPRVEPEFEGTTTELVVGDSVEPAVVLQALADAMASAGTPVATHLWLLDPATDTLRLVEAVGTLPPPPIPVAVRDSVLGRPVLEGREVLAPLDRKRGPGDAYSWRVAAPIRFGETSGVAAVDFQGDAEPDRTVVSGILRSAQGVLVASLASHIAEQETSAARDLLRAAQDLTRVVEPSAVLEALLTHAADMLQSDTASIMLADEQSGTLKIATARGLPDEIVTGTAVPKGEGIAGLVFATGKSLVVEDQPGRATLERRHGVRSAISVPIADDEGILGVLNVGSRSYSTRLSQSALTSLESLGHVGASALRHARAVDATGDLYFDTLKTLALALETKDPCSHGGTERVVGCTAALGKAMGLDEDEARALEIAALLHDIGMIATGDASGVRKRPLTTVEWGLLKMHPVVAAELLQQAPTLKDVAPIVFHHHEHYDGTGYSSGLAGEDIPLAARVLSVADAYVAMTSERPYRRAMGQDEALAELDKEAGAQFDPHVVAALHDVLDAERLEPPAWCA